MTHHIVLPWPPSVLRPNARTKHWSVKARAAAKARADARHVAQAVGARALGWDGAAVRLTFCPPDRRVRDLDGCLSSAKSGLDGIADATGVDDSRWSLALAWGPVVRGGAVIVEISEAAGRGVAAPSPGLTQPPLEAIMAETKDTAGQAPAPQDTWQSIGDLARRLAERAAQR